MSKTYRTRLLLGARSDSDDADGSITPVVGALAPTAATVETSASAFVGVIEQVPPAYSATKVNGRRAYHLARQGGEVSLRPRSVHIYAIKIRDYAYPYLDLEVDCGKGTYIRSLARDLGKQLGCGALVQNLRRTRVGPFTAEEALTLDSDAETAHAHVLPTERAVAELPRRVLGDNELTRLCQGQKVSLGACGVSEGKSTLVCAARYEELHTAVFDSVGRLAAIAVFDPARNTLQPAKVLQSK